MRPDNRCTFFVPSCDPYADLWTPFFHQLWRHWPDCPFPVVLGANERRSTDPRVRTLGAAPGVSWSDRLREQLSVLDTPWVLMCLEDFMLRAPVSTRKVLDALALAERLDAHVVRLIPRPAPDVPLLDAPGFGSIRVGAPYRVSTQAAIWRREHLLALMRPGESIWEFERLGSRRADAWVEGFYGTFDPVLPYWHHVVERGKWFPHAVVWARRHQVPIDLSQRATLPPLEYGRWLFRKSYSVALDTLPWPWRIRLRRALGRAEP